MRVEGILNMPSNQNFSIIKKGQGNIKSDIDVANVLLQLKEKDEIEVGSPFEEIKYQKRVQSEKLNNKNFIYDNFKSSPVSLSSFNNNDLNKNILNNNPYRSPSSTVYSSPVLGHIDKMENDNRNRDNFFLSKEREDYFYNRNSNMLPPIKYLLETKVVNSPMKDNILPLPDIPSFRNKLNNIPGHLKIHVMEMNKDDLLYYKNFSNQPNDYKISRKSSYSSIRENENSNYNIPSSNSNQIFSHHNSNGNYDDNKRYYPNSNGTNHYEIDNFSRSNLSPNSDHMYNNLRHQPNQPVVPLHHPSIKIEEQNSYNTPYQDRPYYQNGEGTNSSMNYNNSNSNNSNNSNNNINININNNNNNNNLLSNQDDINMNRNMNMNNTNNNINNNTNNNFDVDINKTIKLVTNIDRNNDMPNGINNKQTVNKSPTIKKKEKESRRFPKYIIHILETSYNNSHYPSNNEKDRLVRETNLTHRQINDWFINKRARSSCNHQNRRRCSRKIKLQQSLPESQIVQNSQ